MGLPKIYDRFKAIREAYDSVVNVAENALTNATNAVLMASNALTTANNASSSAGGAQETADEGVAKAEAAQAAADAAQSTADTGVELATNAQNTAYSNRDRIISLEKDAEYYAVCSTAAGTVEKVISVDDEYFGLLTGTKVCVRFENTNTVSAPTLNVNNLGAVAIRYRNATIAAETLAAGRSYEFVYDGAYWQLVGDVDTVLEISDNYETGSSNVAASTNAVKNLHEETQAAIEAASADAQECCDAAMSAAEKAQESADAAQSSADAAQSSADKAQSAADAAQSTADAAQSAANAAQTSANAAQSTADSATTAANNAQSTANSASTAASNAQSTADAAQSTANEALNNSKTVLGGNMAPDWDSIVTRSNDTTYTASTNGYVMVSYGYGNYATITVNGVEYGDMSDDRTKTNTTYVPISSGDTWMVSTSESLHWLPAAS